MPRLTSLKRVSPTFALLLVLPGIAYLIFAPRLTILIAAVGGAALAQLVLTLVRRLRYAAPTASALPAGLSRAPGDRRRQRIVPAELPPPPAPLVGRDKEIEAARAFLSLPHQGSGPRVIVICGEPGIGKTALATALAHTVSDAYPDGQLLARLDTFGADLAGAGLDMFFDALAGPKEKEKPPLPAEYEAFYRRYTRDGRILVILDGVSKFEQVRPLLPAGDRCLAIITSRRKLAGLRAEYQFESKPHEVELGPLAAEAAMQLLDQLVGGERVRHDGKAAAAIVEATDGYPVAIHMAGAALTVRRNWTLEIAVRRLSETRTGRRRPAPFAGILNLCFALLTDQERTALALLGANKDRRLEPWVLEALFKGAFPDSQVTEDQAECLLERLARVRLTERRFDDSTGLLTFRVPVYVHRFAGELTAVLTGDQRLAAVGRVNQEHQLRTDRNTERHLRETVYEHLYEGHLDAALAEARECQALLLARAAARPQEEDEVEVEEGLTLAALAEVYAELGWVDEGFACAEAAKTQGRSSDRVLARGLRVSGTLRLRHHQVQAALDELLAALEVARRLDGDEMEQVRVLRELATAYAASAEPWEGEQYAQTALRLCHGDNRQGPRHLPGVQLAYAKVLGAIGRQSTQDDAHRYFTQAVDLLRRAEQRTVDAPRPQHLWRAWIRLEHATLALDAAEPARSRTLGLSALEGFTTLRHRYGTAHARLILGRAYLEEESVERAIVVLEESHGTFRRCGDRWIEAKAAVTLADAYLRSTKAQPYGERGRQALVLLTAAEQAFATLGDEESLLEAAHRVWTVESSVPSEPLRLWVPKDPRDRAPAARLPADLQRVSWPVP
jgi:NB-ARC domain